MEHDEPWIYVRHARAAGFCVAGQQRQAERLGVDYMDFCANGYQASKVKDHPSPLVRKMYRLAVEEWEAKNGKG